jgi:hypothetical protein
LPPPFETLTGDDLLSLALLHDEVCVFVVVKFLWGVPSSVQVLVDAPWAPGAASAAITNAAGTSNLILLVIPYLLDHWLPSVGRRRHGNSLPGPSSGASPN